MNVTIAAVAFNAFGAALMAVMFFIFREPLNVVLGCLNLACVFMGIGIYRAEQAATHTTEEGE